MDFAVRRSRNQILPIQLTGGDKVRRFERSASAACSDSAGNGPLAQRQPGMVSHKLPHEVGQRSHERERVDLTPIHSDPPHR